MPKTYSAKPSEVTRQWHVVDASQVPLGRLSTQVAALLTGKHKPMYTPHIDCGDFVIVINAQQLVVTGNKVEDKTYYRHSGFPGGIKQATLKELLEKDACTVIEKSVRGMLPVNKLRPGRLARLKVYLDDQHTHAPQKPVEFDIKKYANNHAKERKV